MGVALKLNELGVGGASGLVWKLKELGVGVASGRLIKGPELGPSGVNGGRLLGPGVPSRTLGNSKGAGVGVAVTGFTSGDRDLVIKGLKVGLWVFSGTFAKTPGVNGLEPGLGVAILFGTRLNENAGFSCLGMFLSTTFLGFNEASFPVPLPVPKNVW